MSLKGRIYERGNGFPSLGQLVYLTVEDRVFRTIQVSHHIQVGGAMGNFIDAFFQEEEAPFDYPDNVWVFEEVGGAADYTDEEWEEEMSDCYVMLDNEYED